MRIVGVVDLREGRAVHARAGQRDRYQPLHAVAGVALRSGDAVALARAYVDELGIGELYVADLDALAGGPRQDSVVAAVAAAGARLLLDQAVTTRDGARHALSLGADRVVVALETLPGFDALGEICGAIGGDRVAFSLDLRDGEPVIASRGSVAREPPQLIAARAKSAGAGAVILIDLARVGVNTGLDLDLVARVHSAAAGLELLAGGGLRNVEDLERLADAGCDAALVATALHDGRIGRREIAAARCYRSVSR